MKKIVFLLFFPIYLFALVSPYESLRINEKLDIMINHFVNDSLEQKLPPYPQKGKLKDDSPIKPLKYELYYNFIHRLKNIKQQREKELLAIEQKYEGDVAYYNGRVENLKKFYHDKKNLATILDESINKTYKIFYGKPSMKKPINNKKQLTTVIYAKQIYGYNYKLQRTVQIDIPKELAAEFTDNYRAVEVQITFKHDSDTLRMDKVLFNYKGILYEGRFIDKKDHFFKLKIKINDDIFSQIKINSKKGEK
ncbi:MAG: hypothetical protein U9Q04_10320 [Campylobacterota bacterium]|nr:hypothetical protein [Campylobacterota bacterium]